MRHNDQCQLYAVDTQFWNISHSLNDNSICYHSIKTDRGLDLFISLITKNSTLIFEYWRIIYYPQSKRESNRFIKDYRINIKIDVLLGLGTFRLKQYSIELNKFSCVRIFDIFGYSVPNYRFDIIDNANLSSEYSLSIPEYWQCNKMWFSFCWRALNCILFSCPNWMRGMKKKKRTLNIIKI